MAEDLDFTKYGIARNTGFSLAVILPEWDTSGAGVIAYHDELDRLGKDIGWTKVVGSFFIDEGKLMLGVFIKDNGVIDREPITQTHYTEPTLFKLDNQISKAVETSSSD